MVLYPNAKINIGLNILNKRSDGFHNLETLFVPAPLCDILEVVYCDSVQMHLYGMSVEGDPMDNLCMRAYRLLKERFDIPPVAIHLYKKIPTGAGLGGGSADASFTLIALNELFNLSLGRDDLAGFAAALGSDCPFFIYNTPMLARGRGEILSKYDISLENYQIELVHPSVFISTKEAYAGVRPHIPAIGLQEALSHPIEEWKHLIVNDFEESIFKKYPVLAQEKQRLYDRGAVYAAMSGSGSSLFGLFAK